MRITTVLIIVLVTVSITALVEAHRAGAPPGYTGAPGEGTCADAGCHDSYALNSGGSMSFFISPRDYNQDAFQIEISLTGQADGRFGFQVTAVDTLGSPLGTWLLTDTVNTRTVTGGSSRTYVEQADPGSKHPTCINCQWWTVFWLSPPDTNEPVIFHVTSVLADGDSTAAGDYVRGDSSVEYYRSGRCWDLCGDLNGNGAVTSSDWIILGKSVNYALLLTADDDCADLDDYKGINLRDYVAMWNRLMWGGPELDCIPDQPPYAPLPSTDFVVAMNSVVPAGSSIVRIYPEFRASAEYHSFSADFRFDVNGVIPKVLTPPIPDTTTGAGWESRRIEVPLRVRDSMGIIMITMHDNDRSAGPPGTYLLGWFDIRVTPAPYPRRINFVMEGYFHGHPPGFNTPMMVDTNLVGWEITPVYYTVRETGDINNDFAINSSDIIGLVNYIFKSGGVPYPVPATGDVNCSGAVTSADIIGLVGYVFKGGEAPCDVESECTIDLDQWTCP